MHRPRERVFRRVNLTDLYADPDWRPAEREDGTSSFSLYSSGHGMETLVEREPEDCAGAIDASMKLRW